MEEAAAPQHLLAFVSEAGRTRRESAPSRAPPAGWRLDITEGPLVGWRCVCRASGVGGCSSCLLVAPRGCSLPSKPSLCQWTFLLRGSLVHMLAVSGRAKKRLGKLAGAQGDHSFCWLQDEACFRH